MATKEEILESIAAMSVMDVVELVSAMEEKFGVSAAAAAAAPAAAGNADAGDTAEVKDEFTVVLTSFGDKKVGVIKAVRAITGLGLKESKDLVEGVPSPIKESVTKDEAEKFKADLEAVGASVELK